MPGENCGFYGCTNNRTSDLNRRSKNPTIPKLSYFRIPYPNEKESDETKEKKVTARNEWIRLVCRTRVRNSDLERQFNENKFYLCEIHFNPDDIDEFPTRKVLRTGSVPCRNLPKRSHDDNKLQVSRPLPIRYDHPEAGSKGYYSSFSKLVQAVQTSNILPWTYELTHEHIILALNDREYFVPRFYVKITNDFIVTCFYYGWRVPDLHMPNIQENVISNFLSVISNATICNGIESEVCGNDTISHVVPKKPTLDAHEQPFICLNMRRSKSCNIFINCELDSLCCSCKPLFKGLYLQRET